MKRHERFLFDDTHVMKFNEFGYGMPLQSTMRLFMKFITDDNEYFESRETMKTELESLLSLYNVRNDLFGGRVDEFGPLDMKYFFTSPRALLLVSLLVQGQGLMDVTALLKKWYDLYSWKDVPLVLWVKETLIMFGIDESRDTMKMV